MKTRLRVPTLVALSALALSACSADNLVGPAAQQLPSSAATAASPSEANFEIKFMENMIDHHMMAIMMAEVCLDKAETESLHERLVTLCGSIISAQSAEIQQLQGWLAQWYGVTYEPQMKQGDQKMLDKLAALSPAEFEIEFMQMMIEHHEKAIKMAQECVRRAAHAELRQLCEHIIAAQSAEIQEMQTWLCQWYGEC